jgi:phospholipid-binding lipoprotein MlaA
MKKPLVTFAFAAICACVVLSGCAGVQPAPDPIIPPMHAADTVLKEDVIYPIEVQDPWEGFNRRMYRFNFYFDKYVFLPVVGGYETVTPNVVQTGVSNFFGNIGELFNFTNCLFQLKGKGALNTTGRFVINSTIGIAGLFDWATPMGIKRESEDFGQTLGHYGVGSGPYLVLPIFGPSNVRDASGLAFDTATRMLVLAAIDPYENCSDSNKLAIEASLYALEAIDKRHRESFRYYETGSPFEYTLVRWLYSEKRKVQIAQ